MNQKTLAYILKRILLALLTVWIVLTITFFVMHFVPGGPFVGEKAISPAVMAAMEAKYGLDKPLFTQYITYGINTTAPIINILITVVESLFSTLSALVGSNIGSEKSAS